MISSARQAWRPEAGQDSRVAGMERSIVLVMGFVEEVMNQEEEESTLSSMYEQGENEEDRRKVDQGSIK